MNTLTGKEIIRPASVAGEQVLEATRAILQAIESLPETYYRRKALETALILHGDSEIKLMPQPAKRGEA